MKKYLLATTTIIISVCSVTAKAADNKRVSFKSRIEESYKKKGTEWILKNCKKPTSEQLIYIKNNDISQDNDYRVINFTGNSSDSALINSKTFEIVPLQLKKTEQEEPTIVE